MRRDWSSRPFGADGLLAVIWLCACARGPASAETRAIEPSDPPPAVAQREPIAKLDDTLPPHDVPSPEANGSAPAAEPVTPSATPDAAALTGTWAGTYFYTTATSTGPSVGSVAFFAELTIDAGRVTGSVVEPNTIGDRSTSELRASIQGSIGENGIVRLVKTYDGTGGIDHSVEYLGRLDPVTQQIEGVWKVTGSEGRFVMRRHNRMPELARR